MAEFTHFTINNYFKTLYVYVWCTSLQRKWIPDRVSLCFSLKTWTCFLYMTQESLATAVTSLASPSALCASARDTLNDLGTSCVINPKYKQQREENRTLKKHVASTACGKGNTLQSPVYPGAARHLDNILCLFTGTFSFVIDVLFYT